MGVAHIGPIVDSAKKKAPPSARAAPVASWMNRMGIEHASDRAKPPITRSRRARTRLPVVRKMRSLRMPPSASPNTPPKNTIEANRAEFLRLRW